jgi:hypothetical protein
MAGAVPPLEEDEEPEDDEELEDELEDEEPEDDEEPELVEVPEVEDGVEEELEPVEVPEVDAAAVVAAPEGLLSPPHATRVLASKTQINVPVARTLQPVHRTPCSIRRSQSALCQSATLRVTAHLRQRVADTRQIGISAIKVCGSH